MKIAILGGSFNPVGTHHRTIIEEVLGLHCFDRVVILPCGPRPDKQSTGDVEAVFRAAMLDIAFRDLRDRVEIDLLDMEKPEFTRTIDIEHRYAEHGEVWHVVGFDLVEGGKEGRAPIQRYWHEGRTLWSDSRFVVIKRKGYAFNASDLPPHAMLVDKEIDGSSAAIRNKRFNHRPITGDVATEVEAYIERYNLYRGRLPLSATLFKMEKPRLLIVADPRNLEATRIAQVLEPFSCPEDPNLIADIGGDGNKLKAIREHWQMRLPFFGINAGHRGYLLNDVDPEDLFPLREPLVLHHLPLLQVDLDGTDGERKSVLGFNEVWLERETGQSAWLEVVWDDVNRIPRVVGDGLMVSTAAGSTGYAQNVCGFSLPTYVKELLLVGMSVSEPEGWRNAIFPHASTFRIRCLDLEKRPVEAFVDGKPQGRIESVTIRYSKIASVELAFLQGFDIAAKHTRIQLPYFQDIQR